MPELPEVEITRRSIAERLDGARCLAVRLGKPLRWALGVEPSQLVGRRIGQAQRRGKYIWLPLGPQEPGPWPPGAASVHAPGDPRTGVDGQAGGLLLHLGMSGALAWHDLPSALGPHDHFQLETDRGCLRLHDPRRFGAVVWSRSRELPPASTLLARLGPEPFDPALDASAFHAALQRRRVALKPLLLSGEVLVGAGNIYACEALFKAGLHPGLQAARVSRPRAQRLLAAVREVLARALELGGSTLRDFHDPHGMEGAFQQQAAVYGREGQPCPACGHAIRRWVQAQRSTYFCPRCQRR